MRRSSRLSHHYKRKLPIIVCACLIMSQLFNIVAPPQAVQAAQVMQTAASSQSAAAATPPPAYNVPSSVYLPVVSNKVAPAPTPTAEPVVSLAKGCETPGATRNTELKQMDATLSTLY